MSTPSGLGHYASVNAYGAATSADPLQMILQLMNGAVDRIVTAKGCMQRRDVAAKGREIGRAISIIDALRVSLDPDRGGSIATNLEALYDYMNRRLLEGNARDDVRCLDEVVELLGEIRAGWQEISRTRSAAADAGSAA
jgi:flagellar protein FliS